jgi:hypothetical protein
MTVLVLPWLFSVSWATWAVADCAAIVSIILLVRATLHADEDANRSVDYLYLRLLVHVQL